MGDLFEQVVKATCDRDDAFLMLLRNIIKETLHGTRGKFREEMKVFLFDAAKKRKRDEQLDHTMSDGIWKDIDRNNVRFTDYEGSDKVIIKVSLNWNEACDAEMAKRTKGPSSANGNEAVKQQEVKVKPEEVNVKPEVTP